ncbi:MAG: double-strand break repair protein AddB [Rhizobiales bacterium]|nr:double-strand break repair protein AddB [Hyphomicrobiales bacterium]
MNVFTIAPGVPFLKIVAEAVLAGFPGGTPPSSFELARATILVPTRRAARALERLFFEAGGGRGLLLPRIRPIGDIDETLFGDDGDESAIATAVSPQGRQMMLISLIGDWARENPETPLAREIAAAPQQAINLATSLAELIDGLETEEIDVSRLPDLYGLESARHREAILGFLSLVQERLPEKLHRLGELGPMARRSIVVRQEARRLSQHPPPGTIIAAGSTGSIPATAELLAAIARLPRGAVILPGLDTALDDASWAEVGDQHPQHALKQLLDHLGLARSAVATLPTGAPPPRSLLVSEIMRPPATAEAWGKIGTATRASLAAALAGVTLVEAGDLREEAQVIALVLRQTLETPGKTASLVTPDRQLARRVKQELGRFGIVVDDSAGEPLIRFGVATLLSLLIDAALAGFPAEPLLALIRHQGFTAGFDAEWARRGIDLLDLAMFRAMGPAPPPELSRLAAAISERRLALKDERPHRAIAAASDEDWAASQRLAERLAEILLPLADATERDFAEHLRRLRQTAMALADPALWQDEAGRLVQRLLDHLEEQAPLLGRCTAALAFGLVRQMLAATPLRRAAASATPRLTILGLLEARLTSPDRVVLGGLNEGRWPALPEPGPWLSRPMRGLLGLQQPERQIGQTAHDFTQALGCGEVFLVWSKRVGDAPAIPSRWILRLQALAQATGLVLADGRSWTSLARSLAEPARLAPHGKPRPRPPAAARPRKLSVTRIETLIRDPYAIYAGEVLRLEPLDGAARDAAVRGSLFHRAIGKFLERFPLALPADAEAQLVALAQDDFAGLSANPAIVAFWGAQFARIAHWLVTAETEMRAGVTRIFAEVPGKLELAIAGETFTLTCRADRIDLFGDGSARIGDYKTGKPPTAPQVNSGLAPQLTLEAAMLEHGAFEAVGTAVARQLCYIKLGTGDPAGEVLSLKLDDPAELGRAHLDRLKALIAAYADPAQAFLPRARIEKEDDATDLDHLSRYREWALSGIAP